MKVSNRSRESLLTIISVIAGLLVVELDGDTTNDITSPESIGVMTNLAYGLSYYSLLQSLLFTLTTFYFHQSSEREIPLDTTAPLLSLVVGILSYVTYLFFYNVTWYYNKQVDDFDQCFPKNAAGLRMSFPSICYSESLYFFLNSVGILCIVLMNPVFYMHQRRKYGTKYGASETVAKAENASSVRDRPFKAERPNGINRREISRAGSRRSMRGMPFPHYGV